MKWRYKAKDIITDLIGLGILVMTGLMVYKGAAQWLWEGVAGFVVGGAFFLLPDAFLKRVLQDYLKKKSK